ncbi:MAG: hypothetical protein MUQ32_14810 [Chloroflexi bacterium]|nr:hypothetical protein [Chloroflexota bacterium]
MITRRATTSAVRRLAAAGLSAITLLGLVAVTPGPAGAHSPDPVLAGGLFAQNANLRFKWATGGTPPAAMRTAINDAAAASNASRKSKAPTFTYDTAGSNTVYYGVDVPCGVNGLACFRRDAPTWFAISFREDGHRFDWGTLRWCEMNGDPTGCYDAENVMLDELGHVLGLDHHVNFADDSDYKDAVVQTYTHAKAKVGWNAHVFGRCDVATLQQQYDVASSTTLYSTCLDIPSRTTLSVTSASVVAGSVVTFTATLASAGTGRLAGNPMAGRVVVLQWLSGGTWTDAMTLKPGAAAGSYVGSLTMRGSGDYRAAYRKTSTEGVRTSTSAAIRIVVAAGCTQQICPLSVQSRLP